MHRAGPRSPRSIFPTLPYAYHFDAGPLRRASCARYARGSAASSGSRAGSPTSSATATAATSPRCSWRAAQRIEGDLFIDCTGFRALLIGRRWTTGYRGLDAAGCPATARSRCRARATARRRPYTRATAHDGGLAMAHPAAAPHRQRPCLLQRASPATTRPRRHLLANLDGEARRRAAPLRFTTGRRKRAWSRNCRRDRPGERLPRAAGIDQHPSDPVGHRAADQAAPRAARRRRAARRIQSPDRLRDRTHPRLPHPPLSRERPRRTRSGGVSRHGAARHAPRQDRALAASGGHDRPRTDELFTEDGWLQVLAGQGIAPAAWHPLADTLPDADLAGFMRMLADQNVREATAMKPHAAFLRAAPVLQ